jgi:isoleucyl-tRNA synthetase
MGVHHGLRPHAEGRLPALQGRAGFDTRYQNGFDSQGLHVEVEVEKALGLNSKREIETYGLAEFAAKCRERVAHYSAMMIQQSKRLGMWMDWGNDYFTFSDTNIEYIWRFLKECTPRLAVQGPSFDPVVPALRDVALEARAGGEENYALIEHPSLEVRFRSTGARTVARRWTTTPWTLPANVAAAVKPDAEYGRREDGDWSPSRAIPRSTSSRRCGRGACRPALRGPFDHCRAGRRRASRHPVGCGLAREGTGIVHIAPGAGGEDFDLSREFDLRC